MPTTITFDANRAILREKNMFQPYYVKQTKPLQQAVEQGIVDANTDLLLLDHPQQPVALVKSQMFYHHVAQGDIAGEPWMVTF